MASRATGDLPDLHDQATAALPEVRFVAKPVGMDALKFATRGLPS